MVADCEVECGQLLWQAGKLCVADKNYRREEMTNAVVLPLTGAKPRKFNGRWLVPVSALLKDSELLSLHDGARRILLDILAEVRVLEPNITR